MSCSDKQPHSHHFVNFSNLSYLFGCVLFLWYGDEISGRKFTKACLHTFQFEWIKVSQPIRVANSQRKSRREIELDIHLSTRVTQFQLIRMENKLDAGMHLE